MISDIYCILKGNNFNPQSVVDQLATGELNRETGPLPEDYSTSIEAMLFSGENNSIILTREYFLDYACQFNLRNYPFDTQERRLILR